jgi:hypothetical protein
MTSRGPQSRWNPTLPPQPKWLSDYRLHAISGPVGALPVPHGEFSRMIDGKSFAEALEYAAGLAHVAGLTLCSISYALTSVEDRVPRRLTRKDTAAVTAAVTEMARLKGELAEMLGHVEDWQESQVAMTASGRVSHTS